MVFARLALCMTALLVMFRIFCQASTKQCDKEVRSTSGMMLQNHIFRRIPGPVPNLVCLQECSTDVKCQSFNFVISEEMCELNDRTKEARPEDYVPDSDRFYFGLPRIGDRGGLSSSAILGHLDRNKYVGKLMSYLDPVLSDASRSEFVRCWHAKKNGSAASTFHRNCDGKGPTVTIIEAGNYIFGGYTDVSWHNKSCGYSSASKAFLFSLYNAEGYNPVKLTQYQQQQYAMYICSSYLPTFGDGDGHDHDIYMPDNALSNPYTYTRCGSTYSVPSGYSAGDCGFFTGDLYFTPTDIEVFYEQVN